MIRVASAAEAAGVEEWFAALDASVLEQLMPGHALMVDDDGGVSLAASGVSGLPAALLEVASRGGVRIGDTGADGFLLGLQGAVAVAGLTQSGTIRVKALGARSFLYGKDILGDSVLGNPRRLRVGDACIVCDQAGEPLGIGEVVGSFKGQRAAVRALHDLGEYLRAEAGIHRGGGDTR